MLAVILGSGIVFLDTNIINVALPRIGLELPRIFLGRLEGQSYVHNAYLLALSALLVIAGAINDRYGRRKMFSLGLAGFGLTSILCAVAWNMEALVVFRILQGISGAVLVPGSLSLIRSSFHGELQGRAFGLWAGASGAITILGPVLGGFLVDSVSWRAAFLINVPWVVLAVFATRRYLAESRDPESSESLDWVGAAVVILSIGGLSLGAIRGQETQWKEVSAFIALGVGAAATIAFPWLMRRSKNALVPLHLFSSRNFTITNVSTFLIYGALYVSFFFITLFLQGTLSYTATGSGVALLPSTLFLTFLSTRFGRMAAESGPRKFMIWGPVVMALGFIYLARVPASSAAWELRAGDPGSWVPTISYLVDILPGVAAFGLGLAIMVAPLTMAFMTSVPERHSGVASAVNNAISRVGPQLAGAAIFVVISASFYSGIEKRVGGLDAGSSRFRQMVSPLNPIDGVSTPSLERAVKEESTEAFRIAMLVSAGLMVAGAAVNMRIRDQDAIAAASDPLLLHET